jgi:catechol 2,3-dioxygenase-like lactoylglutathione lyase family enzyme
MFAPARVSWCWIMSRSFRWLLTIVLVGFAAITTPSNSRAATLHDSDYVRIGVPDLPQAVTFFRDVLDCQLINEFSAIGSTHESRLLACDSGSIVELFDNHGAASPSPARHPKNSGDEPIQFISDDVANADQWLRRAGVRVLGSPQTLTSGPHAGQTVVNFVSPWGLRLQLVSWKTNAITAGP